MSIVEPPSTADPLPAEPCSSLESGTSPCRIHVLPDLLVNKIAAGEVVERPASVVKELVENSLDAGATRVAVAIEEGGGKLIRVTDDGSGMTPDELLLAVQPHATSKISAEDDLYAVRTLGFRGEALASISSVSKLRIVSRTRDALEGGEVRVAGEQFESAQAAGCPVGTTVEVRDLFFNVPARRKFLRAVSTEVGHVTEQVARLALAHPCVGFTLTNNGRTTQNLPACNTRLERIAKFYGIELASALMKIERTERGLAIEAYAAPPSQSRATAQWQYVYVNGRYIRDRFIQHAVKEAYRGLMEPNRHGVVFLFLTISPGDVDVNVHPTKLEVRWADSNLVHSQVLSALREAFQRADLAPALRTDRAGVPIPFAEQDRIRREAADSLKQMLDGALPLPDQPGATGGSQQPERPMPATDPIALWRSLYASPKEDAISPAVPLGPYQPNRQSTTDNRQSRPRAVQMHNLYLVAETEEGIIIIDQHALHERVLYEQLRERITAGPLESQRLLLPESLPVTPKQQALLEIHQDLLHRLGVEVTPFSAESAAVHTFPSLLKDTDVTSFMRDLLDYLAQQSAGAQTEVVIHRILDMMACKAAVKAGDPLTDGEIDALIQKRHLIDKATSCPHGRPTILRLTKADLNRQFKR